MATRSLDPARPAAESLALFILLSVSLGHLLNDMMQSLVPALYPILKDSYALTFGQIGFITLAFQCTASMLQPVVGMYTDKKPQPYSLMVGMGFTLVGLLLMSQASSYPLILFAAALIGMGSSVFHPEASRVARMAAGGRYGLAQSLFQVGGNTGQAIGPLLVALIVIPHGQEHAAWFALAAVVGIVILSRVGAWYRDHLAERRKAGTVTPRVSPVGRNRTIAAIAILIALTFSKNFYMAAFASYYNFFLMDRFALSVQDAQLFLFLFMGAVALGTFVGGPVGDRIGRKPILWLSIVGVLPLSLALPFVDLFWTNVLAVVIGIVMASAFPAIIVYAQELMPGRVGMVAGLFFGFAFGMGGIGAVAVGWLADLRGIQFAFQVCAILPALGLLVVFLPNLDRLAAQVATRGSGGRP